MIRRRAVLPCLVLGIPTAAYTSLVLAHFYRQGAYFYDTGLIGSLLWHDDLRLSTPPVEGGGSFYGTHISPAFSILTLLSQIVPLTVAPWYGLILGIGHSLPSLGVFWLLTRGLDRARPWLVPGAALLAILFAFNGLALAIIRVPHPEILIAGGLILVFVALVLGHRNLTRLAVVGCLSIREDAGFHLFAFAATYAVLAHWRGRHWALLRPWLVAAAVGLGWSSLALIAQRVIFREQESAFVRVYLGDPAFGRLSAAVIASRIVGCVMYRSYLLAPALIAGLWAIRLRNPLIVAGYLACLPWTLLQLLAESGIAGGLAGYYAFPFLVAAVFPLFVIVEEARRTGVSPGQPAVMAWMGAMLAASLTGLGDQWNPGRMDLVSGFLAPPGLARQAATLEGIAALTAARPTLGPLLVDQGVLSLAPRDFPRAETIAGTGPSDEAAVIAWFEAGFEATKARDLAAAHGLAHRYRLAGTAILVASAQPIEGRDGLANRLLPEAEAAK
jgi:hypothetical protein